MNKPRIYYTWSEAIRAGIAMRPVQAFHKFFDPETGGTCANGAALEAIFGVTFDNDLLRRRMNEVSAVIGEYYRESLGRYIPLPCECVRLTNGPEEMDLEGRIHRLDGIAVHLNNHHRWTRERIADWLEDEEEKLGYITVVESEVESVSR